VSGKIGPATALVTTKRRSYTSRHGRWPLVPGVLTNARLEDGARVVSFANGMVVRELIVDLDDEQRCLAYAATGGRVTHHNASIHVMPEDERRCRLVWITDVLPHEMAAPIGELVEQGACVMKQTLEIAPRC
jgi:hypothetical protein